MVYIVYGDKIIYRFDIPGEDAMSIESGEEANFQKLYELSKEELKKQISANAVLEARAEELNRYASIE